MLHQAPRLCRNRLRAEIPLNYWMDLVCMFPRRISARTGSVRSLRILASQSNTVESIGVPSEKQGISSDAFLCPASMRQIGEVYSIGQSQ